MYKTTRAIAYGPAMGQVRLSHHHDSPPDLAPRIDISKVRYLYICKPDNSLSTRSIPASSTMKAAVVLFAFVAAATAIPQSRVCQFPSMQACYNVCSQKSNEAEINYCIGTICSACQLK